MGLGPEELRALFTAYQETGDRNARDQLAEAHLPLATHLAKRFERRGEPLEDLIQVASLGLLKAIDRFEPDRGLEFSTFAVPTIVGELKRHFRDRAWSVRVPRRLQELHLELGAAIAELTHELLRSPTIPELAERVGAPVDEVLEAMEAGRAYRSGSLDAPGPAGSDPEHNNSLAARLGAEDPLLGELIEHTEIAALLDTLPERERTIVVLRFYAGLTQSQIGERIGISQMHVSRLLSRTLEQLRERTLSAEAAGPE
jgi:RNA polymerase sigma-B factor